MKRAAETAARIATAERRTAPVAARAVGAAASATSSTGRRIDVAGLDKREAARAREPGRARVRFARSSRWRHASPKRCARSWSSPATGSSRATSSRSCASASARSPSSDGKREAGRSGGGGRMTIGYFDGKSPEWHAERGGAPGARAARRAARLPPGRWRSCSRRATAASSSTKRSVTGSRPTSTARARATTPARSASRRERALHRRRRRDASPVARLDQRRRRGQRAASERADRERQARGYMHDRLSAQHYKLSPTGNGRRESFACAPMPRMTNTILLAGPHDPEEILQSVKRGVFAEEVRRRSGRHLERRLRLLAHRELPHRGWANHRAAQGREPHRQRSGNTCAR